MTPAPPDTPLADAVRRIENAGGGLLGIGIPRCPASALLQASLGAVADGDPDRVVAMSTLRTTDDWAERETCLWPRGIRVSRASVPVVARYADGQWVTRQGAAPASVLSAWLDGTEGRASDELHRDERRVLEDTAPRRAQRQAARQRGVRRGAE